MIDGRGSYLSEAAGVSHRARSWEPSQDLPKASHIKGVLIFETDESYCLRAY